MEFNFIYIWIFAALYFRGSGGGTIFSILEKPEINTNTLSVTKESLEQFGLAANTDCPTTRTWHTANTSIQNILQMTTQLPGPAVSALAMHAL